MILYIVCVIISAKQPPDQDLSGTKEKKKKERKRQHVSRQKIGL